MRLHRLSLTAIGPFAGHVELDLARLGESGLFLLEGPTGSGKSTVLDAITFALYGKLAQRTATADRLKSHHAAATAEPVVELVFETQSGVYRIRRTPSYERPKKRTAGNIKVNMTVKLWRLTAPDAVGELISASIGDAEDEITRAVGLTHGQFVQTVLLPQGEFANFLHAGTTEKRALLQRLFGTELHARTQEVLIAGRREAEQHRATAATLVEGASHSFAGATSLSAEQLTELVEQCRGGDCAAVTDLIASLRSTLAEAERSAAKSYRRAAKVRQHAEAAEARARELSQRRDTRRRLQAEQLRLAAAGSEIESARDQLDAAERALAVQPAAAALATALARSDSAREEQARLRAALPDEFSEADDLRLHELAGEYRGTLGELSVQLRLEAELEPRRAECDGLARQLAELSGQLAQARLALADLPARQAELNTVRQSALVAVGQLPALSAERARAAARLVAAESAQAAAAEAITLSLLTKEVFEAAEGQRIRLQSLQTSWRASIASELGLALQSGDPCAVCGSVEHPRPARPTAGHVSREQVISAEDELRRLTDSVERRRSELSEQQAEQARLEVAADSLTPELAAGKLAKVTAQLTECQREGARVAELDSELAELAETATELAEQTTVAERAVSQLDERHRALAERLVQEQAAVEAARAGFGTVADRAGRLRHDIDTFELAARAIAEAQAALAAALSAGEEFRAALLAAGFLAEPDWQQARRTSAQLADLRAGIREHEAAVTAVTARLDTAELTDPALDEPAEDPAELAAAITVATDSEEEAARAHGAAADRAAAAERTAEQLLTAVQGSSAVLTETAPAIRLGNLVGGLGDNQLKMELTTYVLVRRFTEIVAAANSQLRQISDGRYELEHTDARSGNSRSGLGLRVLDLHTGRPRDPGTLSGGETFYVSLSLALGLADIVRAESGGLDLGTLFIDEGFGSLDPDVLDQVLAVLDGLRAGGRVVGVVSHLSELKARIADQLQIQRLPDGSSRARATG